jgi:hypothetical protein
MFTKGVVLLHDDAWPHTAARTNASMRLFNWEIFDNRPYSPDLAPCDYHLFTEMVWLGPSVSTPTKSSRMESTTGCITWRAAPFFDEGLQKLVSRYDKCLNVDGNYVEK